jgi:GntR family transcriptional regulator/MocR family aminotransferase
MAIQWSGLGPDLLLPLDRSLPEPLRVQLETGLREAIRGGRLPVGERLPSSRELARTLGVSRGLVQECFSQLQAEGYLSSQVGSATRVAAHANTSPGGSADVPPDAPAHPPEPRLSADFLPAVPDLASFPRSDSAWAVQQACRDAPNAALGYGDHRGSVVLRGVLAGYLARVRGAAALPERLVVCAGFCQGPDPLPAATSGPPPRADRRPPRVPAATRVSPGRPRPRPTHPASPPPPSRGCPRSPAPLHPCGHHPRRYGSSPHTEGTTWRR